jgi:hypothetical protein
MIDFGTFINEHEEAIKASIVAFGFLLILMMGYIPLCHGDWLFGTPSKKD